jgi:phosphodiesterase/alkaline phosphatase D-like protein
LRCRTSKSHRYNHLRYIILSNIILQSLNNFPAIKVGVESGPNDASEDDEQVLWTRRECTKEHIGLEQAIVRNMNEVINYTNSTQLVESVETETSKANTTDITWIKTGPSQ